MTHGSLEENASVTLNCLILTDYRRHQHFLNEKTGGAAFLGKLSVQNYTNSKRVSLEFSFHSIQQLKGCGKRGAPSNYLFLSSSLDLPKNQHLNISVYFQNDWQIEVTASPCESETLPVSAAGPPKLLPRRARGQTAGRGEHYCRDQRRRRRCQVSDRWVVRSRSHDRWIASRP